MAEAKAPRREQASASDDVIVACGCAAVLAHVGFGFGCREKYRT